MRIVYNRPMRDHGESHFINISYLDGPAKCRIRHRVRTAAPNGIPKKTATFVATTGYETSNSSVSLITLMKRTASGANKAI